MTTEHILALGVMSKQSIDFAIVYIFYIILQLLKLSCLSLKLSYL